MAINFRIYVASLSDYNNGILHGAWIDFEDCASADCVRDKISAMLATSPYTSSASAMEYGLKAEEWAIHDYELPGSMKIDEYEDIDLLWSCYETIQELEEDEIEPFFAFLDNEGGKYPLCDDIENFRNAYRGTYSSEEEFAEELVDELGYLDEMPDHLRSYFDYAALARDLFMGDYYMVDDYVFSNNY
ncbi:MAG: antirestriction protein ArdA [Desulfovibrio sp.]|uniref:antirestriction protein ArdA n=1 Tax=Desulfovibrio sp. TaxID=885 RepID=UPI00258DA55D|nr:antirestriction protein ArdA [Desulfovibrio sp.]MCD7985240.1 antirestriction protein ArdA [Desulfovibrio sp.]